MVAGQAARRIRIRIGVHVTAASQCLPETLLNLYETTPQPFELVVLADPGPGEAEGLAAVLDALRHVPVLAVPGPGGGPASFNGLVAAPADIYVFVDGGVRFGPDWLAYLLGALDADPANGLAGPSTNRCWNEQQAAPSCGASTKEVEQQSRALAERHGAAWRSMAPLHSLSEFCLAVRREVVDAVGAADTAFGRGPCWEMDYGARAARAGFRGVWARSAFIRRGPLPAWRIAAEPALLATGKRLYQDRFCGRRAGPDGHALPYHAHCQGDSCADFAPIETTRVYLPLPATAPKPAEVRAPPPLISCAMPTRGRPAFVAQSVAYFRRQDYPNRELIIVYEDEGDLPVGLDDPNIRTVRTQEASIGGKREAAARAAKGEIIVHWDDDDWYGDQRLTRQASPILQGLADITGLGDMLFLSIHTGEFWSVTRNLFSRLFQENVSGGSLMFRRDVWRRCGPYPAISLREEAEFMLKAMRAGARLCRLPGRDLCVYVRHERNTWKFREGQYLQQGEWSLVPEPAFLAADRSFYLSDQPPRAAAEPRPLRPLLVSCIMPTADRRRFVPGAIAQFLAQDHPAKELVILDDGDDPVADLIPAHPAIRYLRTARHRSLGAKRNAACAAAHGEIILHWDDDDWYAYHRIRLQAAALAATDADISGIDRVYFIDPRRSAAWEYVYPGGAPWACGATLCYRRDYWQGHPFADIDIGEDTRFAAGAGAGKLHLLPDNRFFVALVHAGNTSPKHVRDPRWQPASFAQIRALTGPNWPPAEPSRAAVPVDAHFACDAHF